MFRNLSKVGTRPLFYRKLALTSKTFTPTDASQRQRFKYSKIYTYLHPHFKNFTENNKTFRTRGRVRTVPTKLGLERSGRDRNAFDLFDEKKCIIFRVPTSCVIKYQVFFEFCEKTSNRKRKLQRKCKPIKARKFGAARRPPS